MPSFLVRSNLTRGDLRLFLTNEEGYAADAAIVRWTILDPEGSRISGESLPAIRATVGEYYAPWFSDVRNGNYSIIWDIQAATNSVPSSFIQKFFVVDPASYQCAGGGAVVLPDGVPIPGGFAYLTGTQLGPKDLPLYLRNDNGILTDALGVFWTILDVAGNPISCRAAALRCGVGSYWAPWFVSAASGNYSVLWEYQRDCNSPLQSTKLPFSVINPAAPFINQIVDDDDDCDHDCDCDCRHDRDDDRVITPKSAETLIQSVLVNVQAPRFSGGGGGSFVHRHRPETPAFVPPNCAPMGPCDDKEIPRTVHLPFGVLPADGAYTDQQPFQIPDGIDNITFYITYQRGVPGGYAKLELLWGNGVDEVNETVMSQDLPGPQGMYLQNLVSPIPTDNTPVNFILYSSIPGGVRTVRLLASEGGVPAIPGSIGITLTASS